MKKIRVAHVYRVPLQFDILAFFSERREKILVSLLERTHSVKSVELIKEIGDLYFELDPEDDTPQTWEEIQSILLAYDLVKKG